LVFYPDVGASARLRARPKAMTVAVILAALFLILIDTGISSEIISRIAPR
jgi:copper/silver efflux system protein